MVVEEVVVGGSGRSVENGSAALLGLDEIPIQICNAVVGAVRGELDLNRKVR